MHAKALGREGRCLAAYGVLTAIATYPLVLRGSGAVPLGGDIWMYLWNIWWVKRALIDLHVNPFFTPDLYFPYGASLYFHTLNLLPNVIALPVAMTLGLPAAYNIIVFLAFVLSGYGMYRLALYVLRREVDADGTRSRPREARLAAFTAGVIFTFSSYRFVHLLGHPDLASTEWLPFFVLFLLKTRDEPGWINPALCGLLLAATLLTDAYYFVFLLCFVGLFIVHTAWRGGRDLWKVVKRIGVAFVICAASTAPLLIHMLILGRTTGRSANPASDVDRFSADLLAFLLPSPLHSVWGRLVQPAFTALNRGDNGVETVVFLGFVPIALAIVAARRLRAIRSSWLLASVVFGVLALGPVMHIGGRAVTVVPSWLMPYHWLATLPYGDIPRVPARFVVMTLLCLSVVAAAGVWTIVRDRGYRASLFVTAMLIAIVVAESAVVPLPLIAVEAPAFYRQLHDEPSRGGVLEVPIPDDPAIYPPRMFYQTVHGKPVYGGYLARGLPPLPFDAVPGFAQFKTGSNDIDGVISYDAAELPAISRMVLSGYNVGTVVIDKRLMEAPAVDRERQVAETILGSSAQAYEDADVLAYTLGTFRGESPPAAWLDTGWSYLERLPGQDAKGRPVKWRWMANEARIGIGSVGPARIRLRIAAQAFGHDRELKLSLASGEIGTLKVAWREEADYETTAFDIPAGISILDLKSLDPAQPPKTGDGRLLSMALYRLELIVGE